MELTKKQRFNFYGKTFSKFKDPTIRLIIAGIIEHTPILFFGASTSSTGKYHPKETNGIMGLVKHSVAVMLIAEDLLSNAVTAKAFGLDNISELDKEIILAACLLHDNGKYGYKCEAGKEGKVWTKQSHPYMVAQIAKLAGLHKLEGEDLVTLKKIIDLIETHMGQWNTVKDGKDMPVPQSAAQVFVHTCDYLSSKKTMDIVSELRLPEDIDPEILAWFEFQNK